MGEDICIGERWKCEYSIPFRVNVNSDDVWDSYSV